MADETIKGMSTTDKPAEKPAEAPAAPADTKPEEKPAAEETASDDDAAKRARAEYLRAWPLDEIEKR